MYEFYVTIAGARQGAFTGEAAGRHAGKLIGLAYEQASSAPVASGGRVSGRPTFGPVRFTRQWGPASPQFLQALATGEALTEAVFEFVRTTDEGLQEVFHRVRLFGARVVEVRPFIDLDAEPSSLMPLPPLEDVALSYTGMEVENVPSGITTLVGTRAASPRPAAKPRAGARPRPAGAARRR
jgi:type VI secretion system Hcp family effector